MELYRDMLVLGGASSSPSETQALLAHCRGFRFGMCTYRNYSCPGHRAGAFLQVPPHREGGNDGNANRDH